MDVVLLKNEIFLVGAGAVGVTLPSGMAVAVCAMGSGWVVAGVDHPAGAGK